MISHDAFLSAAAEAMRESPIRLMGAVAARRQDLISFAPGYPGHDAFAWEAYRTIADRVFAAHDPAFLQYGPTRGYPPLIEALSAVNASRGIDGRNSQMLVTTGSQQGLDLVARVLLDPGDVVLMESPGYTGAIAAFRNVRAAMAGVEMEADGIDLERLARVLRETRAAGRRVKFLYVVPNFQNPTGRLLAVGRRRALLEWAAREDLLIVEDDPYGALSFDGISPDDTRPLKADDAGGRVIYLSSLSKIMAPGFRTGWVVGPPAIVAKMEIAKQGADLCTSNVDQRLVCEGIRDGVLARSEPALRAYYQAKRDVMEQALRARLGDSLTWSRPKGGFFLWVTLPSPIEARALLDRAVRHGVVFVAGHAFYVDGGGNSSMRLAFSMPDHDQIRDGVDRLAAALTEAMRPAAQAAPSAD